MIIIHYSRTAPYGRGASGFESNGDAKDMFRRLVISALVGLLGLASMSASAAYIGSYDLQGNGQLDLVYREGGVLRIIGANGAKRDYTFGNVSWALYGAHETNARPGLELVVRAGNDLVVVEHATGNKHSYSIGNIAWSILKVANVDKKPGDEILVNIATGVRIVKDTERNYRDVVFNYNGSWALFALADLSGNGPDLVLNMGNGVKIIDPRTYDTRDFTFPGYTAVFAVAQADSKPGLEVIGRTGTDVYIASGGVANGRVKNYPITSAANWAIYGSTADTDGVLGNEVIVIMTNNIRVINHQKGTHKDYSIGSYNYSIDSVSDLDGNPGAEILVRDTGGQIFIINDRLGTIKRQ